MIVQSSYYIVMNIGHRVCILCSRNVQLWVLQALLRDVHRLVQVASQRSSASGTLSKALTDLMPVTIAANHVLQES